MNQTRKDVLNGWKEIAAYLGRDPRTVERWEKQRRLPVRRLPGSGRATVYALTSELDDWLGSSPVREAVSSSEVAPVPGELGAAEAAEVNHVHDARDAVAGSPGRVGATPEARGSGWRGWPWLRWDVTAAMALLLCCAAFATVAWRRIHAGSQPEALAPTARHAGEVVASSAVFGVEEVYLRGCFQMEARTPESLRRAQEAFSEALRRDPKYAPAYAGLANTYLLQREYARVPDAEAYPLAVAAAERALSLDPSLGQAHAAMGFIDFFWKWDGVEADRQFRTALQLNPDLALAHHWYGSALLHQGRFRDGLAEVDAAQRLDPSSAAILTTRAFALGLNGKRDQASDLLGEALSAGGSQNPSTMHAVLATLSLVKPRDLPRYLGEMTLAAEVQQDTESAKTMRHASAVFHAQGEKAMWRALLQDEQRRQGTGGPTYPVARYEAELGAKEQALTDLETLFSRHDPALIGILVDPLLTGVRREPRFRQIQVAMGLSPTAEE